VIRIPRGGDLGMEILETAFRLLPWPVESGLQVVGEPDASSPVVLTGNYDLTVRRLRRALEGQNVWLLVAPSGGINVWCAAAGGHLTTHQIVTALKTSGISECVNHRRVILPQLAATGVLALDVFRRSRWKVRFGPVHARDLPAYLQSGEKTDAMRRVRFGFGERLQMAVMWAAPVALLVVGLATWLRAAWALPLALLIALMSCAVFTLYDRLGDARRFILMGAATIPSLILTLLCGGGWAALTAAVLAPSLIALLLTYDYSGSTPIEGGSHFEERRWTIKLDTDRCEGIYHCWEVCPEACFEKVEGARAVKLAHDERCIRCGACVVQCPRDALYFEDGAGGRIEPEVIRRFKLNLLGTRSIDAG
jgi:NAD-dependent dihydropyrimidine dehydrogenase PreA subunit